MVNRCICSNILFSEVKKIAEKEKFQTVDELRAHTVCCNHCELCRPYIKEMLMTGETTFSPKPLSNQEFIDRKRT